MKIVQLIKACLLCTISAFFAFPKAVSAIEANIKGWDLYGRVPNDDWLFSTWRLTDPKLLKRSLAETVKEELPAVFGNFKRRKRIRELSKAFKSLSSVAVVLVLAGFAYKVVVDSKMRVTRKSDGSPSSRSTSAIAKAGPTKGTSIDFMGAGWYDMEQTEPAADATTNKKKKSNKKKDDEKDADDDDDKDADDVDDSSKQ